jgi:hydroxyacylglutathione hydrolase
VDGEHAAVDRKEILLMLFERIESEGLAHYSYLVGDGTLAAVIDPRRDVEVYNGYASRAGLRITHIFETHRNEDYVTGSVELTARTGAEIWHADAQLDYRYGRPARDGQEWQIGRLRLEAVHTPGHTPGSMTYLLHEPGGAPWIVFTGDTLFAGDVGRVDLLGMDRASELAGWLYESLFGRLLPLSDGVLVCPAHGAGSVCGTAIADRVWTTIGLERKLNPVLQFTDRGEFIASIAQELEHPPYFREMERLNLIGAPVLGRLPLLRPLNVAEFSERLKDTFLVDLRPELSFGAAHVPGALSLSPARLSGFAGWFLPYNQPLLFVGEPGDLEVGSRMLIRLGHDEFAGYLAGGMLAWHTAGRPSGHFDMLTVQDLCALLDSGEGNLHILDVRSAQELRSSGEIPGAQHIHITQLPQRFRELPTGTRIYLFCGSGMRAMIAASLLKRAGLETPTVVLGGLSGWNSFRCPLK